MIPDGNIICFLVDIMMLMALAFVFSPRWMNRMFVRIIWFEDSIIGIVLLTALSKL